jgi:hypothetical protein
VGGRCLVVLLAVESQIVHAESFLYTPLRVTMTSNVRGKRVTGDGVIPKVGVLQPTEGLGVHNGFL